MHKNHWWRAATVAAVVIAAAAFAATARAAVKIAKAEMNSTQLRLEGTALPNAVITVNGVALGSSDSSGNFKIQKDPYAPPANCIVEVDDGSASATSVTLAGCTPSSSSPPPPSTAAAPALAKVTVNPSNVVDGDSATGTVTLTATAPASGVQVTLSSDDPAAEANLPAGVTVPAGSTSASFTITTNVVPNPQSALIIGTAGGVTTYGILTVDTPFSFAFGSISIGRGGNGNGTITSQPAGIDCTITSAGGSGTCGAWFSVGTVVRLDARPASGSSFVGWTAGIGCGNPSKLTVQRDEFISCQPGFVLK